MEQSEYIEKQLGDVAYWPCGKYATLHGGDNHNSQHKRVPSVYDASQRSERVIP